MGRRDFRGAYSFSLSTLSYPPAGTPEVDYIGVDMGEGGYYPLLRL